MKVLNKGKRKVLRSKRLDLIFPSGISEQPEISQVILFVSSNPDLSIYKSPINFKKPKITEDLKYSVENKKEYKFPKKNKKQIKYSIKNKNSKQIINETLIKE